MAVCELHRYKERRRRRRRAVDQGNCVADPLSLGSRKEKGSEIIDSRRDHRNRASFVLVDRF
jgi:hypothetical protein